MRAKSIKGKSPEEIQSALQQSIADSFTPALAIAFISIKQDRNAICELMSKAGINMIGEFHSTICSWVALKEK